MPAVSFWICEEIDAVGVGARDRLLDRWLEAFAEVEDKVCFLDLADVGGSQFQIVRLGSGRCEVRSPDAGAADLLRGVGDRVERRDDGFRLRGGRRPSGA